MIFWDPAKGLRQSETSRKAVNDDTILCSGFEALSLRLEHKSLDLLEFVSCVHNQNSRTYFDDQPHLAFPSTAFLVLLEPKNNRGPLHVF